MKNSLNWHRRLVLFRCFVILASIAIAASQIHGGPCTPPPSGLVGWWPGEGDANDIIGGDNGTLEGGATFAPGKVGQGFRFDGTNGYVQIPDSAALKPTNITCEAWVWLDPGLPPHNGGEQIVFKKNTWTAWFEGYSLIKDTIDNGDGTYSDRFQFCVSRSGNQVAINSQTIALRGVWYHVAGTYDGNQSKLYVNGVLEASATPGFPLDYDTTPIFIGTSGTWAPYLAMFGGIIDEVSIYNRALSDSEIAAIYNAGSAGKCSPTNIPCTPPPAGLVDWWPGEDNANDVIGGNNGQVQNITYAGGVVGDAFYLNGSNAYVKVAASSNLDVGAGNGFTFETWINPANLNPQVLAEWNANSGDSGIGAHFWISEGKYFPGPAGCLYANLIDTGDGDHYFSTGGGVIVTNAYQHIALTYDKSSGTAVIYWNGTAVQTSSLGTFNLQTSFDFYLGERASGAGPGSYFDGIMDEPSLYNRALSAAEIAAIYSAGSAGKCLTTTTGCVVYTNFNSTSGLSLIGNAAVTNGVMRLTPALVSQTGDAWLATKQPCASGFDTTFHFAISQLGNDLGNEPGGDGFTFAVQNLGPTNQSWAMGDTNQFVAVFFNTFWNWPGCTCPDVSDNSVGIVVNQTYIAQTDLNPLGINMSDGATHLAHVNYSGTGFTVWVDGAMVLTNVPVAGLVPGVDGSGQGWVGFTAGTGDAFENHDILDWSFCVNGYTPPTSGVPVISNFSPASGANGTVIAIFGSNFNSTAAANIVYFGAVQANVLLASPTNLMVMVPAGATYAPITVNVGGLTAYSVAPFMPTFPGNGSGISTSSFSSPFNLPTLNGPSQTVIADIDGDGKPDIIVVDGYNNSISIFRNISTNGTLSADSFAPRVDLPATGGTYSPFSITVADVDGDGKLDIIATENGDNLVSVYRNNCTPGNIASNLFARTDFPTGSAPAGVVARDLDGDGRPDIVVCNGGDGTISILQNTSSNGIVSFAPKVDFAAGGGCQHVAAGDLNGDGKPDLAAINGDGTLSLFQNQIVGPGVINTNSFAPAVSLAIPTGGVAVAIVDVDGDGKPDLATTAYLPQIFSVFQNIGTGSNLTINSFGPRMDSPMDGRGHTIAVGDLDGDGKPDLVVDTELNSLINIFRNTSASNSLSLASQIELSTGWNAWGVSVGDLDGDGRPDIVFANSYDNNIYIYRNLVPLATAPVITSQPTNENVAVGDIVTFTVAADGSAPLNYQWGLNSTNLSGATNATLTISNVQLAQAGNYSVIVSNLVGVAVSSNALLTVFVPTVPPSILSQTPNQVVLLGNTATFSVNASGSDPLSYLWQRNGALIPGATNASYSLLNAQLSDSGSKFSCLVTNAYGSASSTNASLKVIDTMANDLCSGAIIITNACYTNTQSTLKASAFGDPMPDCVDGFGHGVWYQFTAPVAGLLIVDTFGSDFDTGLAIYTGSCDSLAELACNDDFNGVTSQVTIPTTAGTTYSILVGGYDSDAGNLVLHLNHLTPPAFTVQPTNQIVVAGSNAVFMAVLDGTRPLSYQWLLEGNPLSDNAHYGGSTTPSLTISNVTIADATGNFSVTVSNILGSVTSAAVNLSVLSITTQPAGRSVPPGLPTTFTATASPSPAPSYQWQLNGTNIPGATGASYTIPAVGTNDLGFYHLLATYPVGVAASADAQLTFGPVAAWGLNTSGECLPPPNLSNVVAVAGSSGASFAIRADGKIVSWGGGSITNIPAGASNVVAVSISPGSLDGAAALRTDGTVAGWGSLIPPITLSNITSVAVGDFRFGFALRAEGTLVGWGAIPYSTPPAGLNHVTAIACGYTHTLALRNDGTVVAWGSGPATNVPAGLANVTAIAAGYSHSLVLKSNGAVVAWGSGSGTNLPAGLTNIMAISASGSSQNQSLSLALRANGTVVAWGDNVYGEKIPPAALSNLVSIAIAAASYHGLALVNDGSPVILRPPVGLTADTGRDVTLQAAAAGAQPLSYQWLLNGTNISGAANTSLFIPNVQSGNAGNYQLFVSNNIGTALSLAAPLNVISNGAVTFLIQPAGQTNYQGGKLTLNTTVLGSGPLRYQWYFSPTNIIYGATYIAVSGATNDTLVLDPALASNTGLYYIAISNQLSGITSTPALQRVLFARAWGYNAVSNPPVNVTNAIALAMSYNQNANSYFALGANGKLTAWAGLPVQYGETNVAPLSNSFVTAIAAGQQDVLALKSDGTVYAWGSGQYGQTNPPTGLSGVIGIACGAYHDLALKADGTVVGWGANLQFNYGQATNNPAATNVVAIAAAQYRSLALRADGTVVSWGYGLDGTAVVPPNLTNVIAITAGTAFNAALRADGKVVQWGAGLANYPVPANLSNVVAISGSSQHCTALKNDGTVVSWGIELQSPASNNVPADLANVIAITSGGEQDMALFGTRAPAFTVQPWDRAFPLNAITNILLAAKCAGVQPVRYQWQLNGTNVPSATNDTLILTNQPLFGGPPRHFIPTGAYQLVASNAYGVAASKYAKVTTYYPLADALDTTNSKGSPLYNWTTSGNAQWFGETNVTHDGVDAAQSGGIGGLQETILQTTVGTNWSGHYTFWWKVSSEQDFDFLEFRVNGIAQASISGQVDWQPVSIPVAMGTNVLQWRYSKDATFDFGQDAGWVDQFAFIPDPPLINAQPVSQIVNMGTNVTLQVTAIGPPFLGGPAILRYQWRQNGNPVGGNSPSLVLNNVGRAQSGTYFVTVTNLNIPNNSIISSNAILKVLVPQLLGSPLLLPDGSFRLTSTDADGGLLSPSDLANFEAQASTNLLNWVTLPNALSLTNGMLLLQDGTQSNYPTRFYRLLEH